jgi:hypothetical protein
MAKNITYLLGAGASYHSIPVVDSLNDRMELFLNMATPHQKGDPIIDKTFYNELNLQSILQKYGNVMLQALKHRTVDTFAKKLFLQKNWDDLHILKEFLCLYFAFEQSPDDRKVVLPGQGFSHIAKEKLQSTLDGLHNHLDYRYDIFLAALLNDEMELPSNINIISWNYDHQFEMAYGDYAKCNFNVSKSKLKIYPHEKCDDGQIIKLNGSANQFILNDRIINFEHHESKRDFFS